MIACLRYVFLPLFLTALAPVSMAQNGSAPVLPSPPVLAAKAWLLMEFSSGQVLGGEKMDERLEPASLTKLMTAYLTFRAIQHNTLALNQPVRVSETAWRTGGSKMFIKVGDQVAVEDLIRGMIVQSGNDACVALAEAIAGSEAAFATMMNTQARQLGMTASQFQNATGLPDDNHYTTARDMARLSNALIRDFPVEYGKYYSLKEFRYANITQPNRNRLLFLDATVDGVKTGHTEAAGYSLIASARRGPRRLVSVVLGTASDKARASESQKLLEWGYQAFDTVHLYAAGQTAAELRLWKGKNNILRAGFADDFIVALPKGTSPQPNSERVKATLLPQPRLLAPITVGQVVGKLSLSVDGKTVGEYPLRALESIPEAGWFGRLWDSLRMVF